MASIYVDPFVRQLAQQASSMCGLDVNVILAQWQCEEGVGSQNGWVGGTNNPAGIRPGNPAVDALANGVNAANFDTFPTPAAGATAYAMLYNTDSGYAGVRQAIATGNPQEEMTAIAASGWDGKGHYNNGQSLFAAYAGITGQPLGSPGVVTSAGPSQTSPASLPGTNAPGSAVGFPPTDYGIVPNSERTGQILYGRKWRVQVQTQLGATLDVSDLRVTFDIQYVLRQTPPFCTVTIYNLNPATEDILLNYGDAITVEAGYSGQQYGLIFSGTIVEPVRSMQDNVTYVLTLNCLQADAVANQAFAAFTVTRGQSARSMVENLASRASIPSPIGQLSDSLSTTPLPRGKTVFGLTRDYLRQIAQGNNLALHFTNGTINMLGAGDNPPNDSNIVDLTPTSGLISIPVQNGLGVSFDCLLNPSITIGSYVRIDNALITAQTFQIGQAPRSLDAAGIYRIMSVEHIGDSRGQQWLTRCTSVSQAGGIPGMLSTTTGNPWG